MVNVSKKFKSFILIVAIMFTVVKGIPSIIPKMEKIALISAGMNLPEGSANYILNGDEEDEIFDVEENGETETQPAGEAESETSVQETSPEVANTSLDGGDEIDETPPDESEKAGNVLEKKYSGSGSSYINSGNVSVQNKASSYTVDIDGLLSQKADLNVKKDGTPYVLIYHTHTTESYLNGDYGWYPSSFTSRNLDENYNMISVGKRIVAQLEAAGYGVIHVTDLYDYPSYNGAYDRSGAMIDEYMQKYPTLQVLLDIHRDAIQYEDGTKVKPTAEINGQKAAQIMIISGCEEGNVTGFPDWMYNLRFALQIQDVAGKNYPGLMRPLYFCDRKYNMHKSHNSLLIEIGTDGNTIKEARYSGELLGKVLVEVLDNHCS